MIERCSRLAYDRMIVYCITLARHPFQGAIVFCSFFYFFISHFYLPYLVPPPHRIIPCLSTQFRCFDSSPSPFRNSFVLRFVLRSYGTRHRIEGGAKMFFRKCIYRRSPPLVS